MKGSCTGEPDPDGNLIESNVELPFEQWSGWLKEDARKHQDQS
ncbi:MAG: hypothetical protein AB1331_05640 [Bacillota bacterium]